MTFKEFLSLNQSLNQLERSVVLEKPPVSYELVTKPIPDQEKNKFFQMAIEEWVKIIIEKYKPSSLWGKDLPQPTVGICHDLVKKSKTLIPLSPQGEEIFIEISIKFEGQEILRRALNLNPEKKDIVLKFASRWSRGEIGKQKIIDQACKLIIANTIVKYALREFSCISFYYARADTFETEIKNIKSSKLLSDEEKSCLVDYFSHYQIESKKIDDVNNLMEEIFINDTPYKLPPFQEVEKLLKRTNEVPPRIKKEFEKDFYEKYIKQLTVGHNYWMEKALPGIGEIYRFLMRDHTLSRKKEKAYCVKAIGMIEKDPQRFLPVKKEHLEDIRIYANFKKSSKERIWLFFGEIFNKIFKDNNLSTMDKNIIYDELRKTDYWKDFASLMMKNQ